jgi:hypothetical protein
MNRTECPREIELLEIITCGRWPDQCPAELRTHIAGCAVCNDVLEVAHALHEDRNAAHPAAHIPSADLVWWRAELRTRQEAIRTASRPIKLVEAFGGAAVLGVVVALVKSVWPWIKRSLVIPDFSVLSASQLGLIIAFALVVLIAAPLAMYVVLSDE